MLDASVVSKRYATRPKAFGPRHYVAALKGVSVAVEEGEVFGIVGESGSGKTTLARIMIGALAADCGAIRLFGEPVSPASSRDRRRMTETMQMVLQDSTATLNPRLSLIDTVAFGPWTRGRNRSAAVRLAEAALDRVGLPPAHFGKRRPAEISGGQRQRVNLARALVLDPKILFLDEPVSALDKTVQAQILNLLVELKHDLGLTLVLISHDLDVIRYLCNRTAVMRAGEIVEQGETGQVFAAPQHEYTRSLLATLPQLGTSTAAPHQRAAPKTTKRPILAIDDLRVSFAQRHGTTRAVRGISLSLQPGEVLAVVGESGSGKSVMLRALLGLLPPTAEVSGRLAIVGAAADAARPKELAGFRGKVAGMVFQDPMGSLDPMASIGRQLENVVMVQRAVARPAARKIAQVLLERAHLAGAAERYDAMPYEFSGGQRQRIGIAMALAGDPAVLLADEPTTALDVSVQARILELMRELCTTFGIGLVLVTHDMGVARQMADRVAVRYAGRIVEEGSAAAVLDAPRHPYTQALLNSYESVRLGAKPLPSLPGAPPRLDAEPKGCAFADRCPAVFDRCRVLSPSPFPTDTGGRCECLLVSHQPG